MQGEYLSTTIVTYPAAFGTVLSALIKNEYPDLAAPKIRNLILETSNNPCIEFSSGVMKADTTEVTKADVIRQ